MQTIPASRDRGEREMRHRGLPEDWGQRPCAVGVFGLNGSESSAATTPEAREKRERENNGAHGGEEDAHCSVQADGRG